MGNDAKDLGKKGKLTSKATKDDYCDKGEFRGLAAYICLYAIMYDAFALIDGGGGDAAAKFAEINAGVDGAKDNVVMLIEFCAWIEKEEAKAGTSWGKLLTAGD